MASSLPSSSFFSRQKYDVYLNFRWEDTGDNFTSHLYAALCKKNIKTFVFFDIDEELRPGDEIFKAIEESKIFIIIFSENYASSIWCLDELVKILECHEMNGQIVIPVLYQLNPSDVRNQTGFFGDAFADLENRFKEMPEMVQTWRTALRDVSNIPGWFSMMFRSERKLVEAIVEDILKKLECMTNPSDFGGLVGINSRIQEIKSLLCIGLPDFRIIGIWGTSGVGKTTVAEAIFNQISEEFEGKCFIANVREELDKGYGLEHLLEQILCQIFKEKLKVDTPNIPWYIKESLRRMRVLIVLDDVSTFAENIIGGLGQFGLGSRIIVTTRDKQVLKKYGVNYIYEIKGLNYHEALELFRNITIDYPHEFVMERVVDITQGNPLVLKVFSSWLSRKCKQELGKAIRYLGHFDNPSIHELLKISYDVLTWEEKCIFLDIACFFNGEDKDYVTRILGDYDSLDYSLNGLVDKSLVRISTDNKLQMHGLLQEMGREIVYNESVIEPGKRSRLWHFEDVYHVLKKNTGTEAIGGMFLDLSKIKDIQLDSRVFANMPNLRLLKFHMPVRYGVPIMNSKVHLPKGLEYLPEELTYLHWHEYPLRTLPLNFDPVNLIELNLPYSKVEQIWEGKKEALKLKYIDLRHSQNLARIPDPFEIPNLETLYLPDEYPLRTSDFDAKRIWEGKKKFEHILVPMKDKLKSLFDEACGRLDSHASDFWNHKDLKQLRLKLAQVYDHLQHSKLNSSNQIVILNLWLLDLKSLSCDVDDLLDNWEQLEISRLKFNQEVRRIHEWLVRFWNSFHKLVTSHNEDMSAISELGSARSDEYTVFERDIDISIGSLKHVLLSDTNMVRIITILGMSGTRKTVLAQRIYSNEKVKSHFPLRFWLKVGMNLDFSTVVKALEVRCCEIRGGENMFSKRLLIVLDNVFDLDDEKLERFRLLISDMRDSGSCVLVTTRSDRVATMMRTVPAQHVTYFTKSDSQSDFNFVLPLAVRAHNHGLGHEKDLRIEASESVVVTELQRYSESGTDEDPELCSEDEMTRPPLIKQSIEPAGPVAALRSIPSNITAVEPVTAPPLTKEAEILPVNEVRTDVSYKTEGDLRLLESGSDVRGSIERTILKIFTCMGDVTITKIGLCGISGIGKTSVLKSLIGRPKTNYMFGLIIMVTVARYWSIRQIQNQVLRQLSLGREDLETDSEVAEKLFHVFSEKKFLLLLDDVWEQIDLKAVGIPDPREENGSKILMASRKLDVFLGMDVTKVITVETVSSEEAWELFHEQVGRIIYSSDIQPFAQTIVKGCGGLPLLIIVTGRALTDESNVSVWEHASRHFSMASAAGMLHTENVIQLLKFSFDQLRDHVVKSCFLHCCLFSEDREINISEFVDYCILEGNITGSRDDALRKGRDIVGALVRATLLQVTEGGDSIKMHHLIRDLALGIISSLAESRRFLLEAYSRVTEPSNSVSSSSSKSLKKPEGIGLYIPEGYQFLLRAGAGLTEPPLEEEWKQAKMIFLMDNDLCTLPEKPNCPKLDTLFLQRNTQLRAIPLSFFDSMTYLKVLNLSKTRIKSLPETLFKLKNLQILILRDCDRLAMLSSEVGSLQGLEVLDLGGTEIFKLPDEVGKLASLRHLEVSFYGSINRDEYVKLPLGLISRGVISRLHALETLKIVVYPGDHRWYGDVKFVIIEVCNLTNLSSLCFHFPEAGLLELFLQSSIAWNTQHLTEFKFSVGHDVKSITSRVPNHLVFDYHQQSQCLRFVNGEKIPDAVLTTLACSTALYLDHHLDVRSLTNFGVSNISGLKFCIISECPKIETVVDGKELTATVLPSLENLSIHHLWNLTCIWEGILPNGSFAELRVLYVHACPRLKYVFSSFMIQSLSKLEQLVVEDCPAMEEIIHDGDIIDSDSVVLPSLKKLTLHYLPGLVNIWASAWPSLEHMSFYDCPKLKNIGVDSNLKDTIIEIKAEQTWWDTLEWEDDELHLRLQSFFTTISEDDL